MKYMGSKARIVKQIAPMVLEFRQPGQMVYDVCCGGGNFIGHIPGPRTGIDVDPYAIAALKLIRDTPEVLPRNNRDFTEEDYRRIRNRNDPHEKAIKGYAGYALSYGGKWFGGWCRDGQGRRDYVAEAYRNAVKQSRQLQGAVFVCANYSDFEYEPGSIIYADPPYRNTTTYKHGFDHDAFYDWLRAMNGAGHFVYISEYEMPDDFICIWERPLVSSLTKNTGARVGVERLFSLL